MGRSSSPPLCVGSERRASSCVAVVLAIATVVAIGAAGGSPVHDLGALAAMAASPSKHLDDGSLIDVLAATSWLAGLGVLTTAAATMARTGRPRGFVPFDVASATLSAVPATVADGAEVWRPRQQAGGRIEAQRTQPRAEMPDRRSRPHEDHPSSPPDNAVTASYASIAATVPAAETATGQHALQPPSVASIAVPTRQRSETPGDADESHLDDPEWTRTLLGLVATAVADSERPLAWLVEANGATAFVNADDDPPAPFRSLRSRTGWWIERDRGVTRSPGTGATAQASRRAALVTLWRDPDARGLLDVVAARTVALDGPPVAVGYTVADVVVELAGRRWSDVDEVILVGFGNAIRGLENVRYLPTLDDAIAVLNGVDRFGELGARCFVIAPMSADERRRGCLRRLLRLVEQTPLTGAVCCDTAVGALVTWQLASHGDTARVEVTGRAGVSAIISPPRWAERTGTSRRIAYRPAPQSSQPGQTSRRPATPDASPARHASGRAEAPARPAGSAVIRPDEVGVLVLGPVEIVGTKASLEGRPLLKELVTYLAFHPRGASGEECATALWPERRVPAQTLANRLHEARRALGTTGDGSSRLVRSRGRHRLSPDVKTDWSEFLVFTDQVSGPASWRRALMLVRGRPFSGLAKGDWTALEGFSATIEARVVDVASRLAEHLLEMDDLFGAEWAIRRGLMIAPWDERLYRLLMTHADAAGNRGGVESALRSLGHALEWSGDPIDVVHPETAALYRRLTERPRR
jgi:DNA-binding SARP family transcriptional activator